ncbi:MAG: hypothetical protein LBL05_09010, partial [Synergistaceae bacterium]|nr:hypothetical protein [Synergistaceae bacterium]
MIYMSDNVKKWVFMIAGIICIASVFCVTALFRGAFASREEIIPVSPAPRADSPAVGAPLADESPFPEAERE